MDNRTIRNAIMKRIPEVTFIELIKHPTKSDKMVIACSCRVVINGNEYALGMEEDDFTIGGSHKELMNVIDRMAEEVKKYKHKQHELMLYSEKGIKSVLDQGAAANANLKKSAGGIILLD